VTVTENNNHLSINIKKNNERYKWVLETGGSYILRTNWKETDPKVLWNTYIQLTEVEDAFRTTKHDLGMRPIFHQKKDRVQAHILVCFFISRAMADTSTVDESVRARDCAEKIAGRVKRD